MNERVPSSSPAEPGLTDLRLLIDAAPDGMLVADRDGRCTFVNETGCELLGYRREELLGIHITRLISARDRRGFRNMQVPLPEGRCHRADWRLRRKDGTWLPVEVSVRALPDGRWQASLREACLAAAKPATARVAGSAERPRASLMLPQRPLNEVQDQLRASERLFRTVFDLLPVGLWIADSNGRITRSNPAGERIWQGTRYVGPEQFGEYQAWWVETGKPITPEEWGLTRAVRLGETSRGELIRIRCFDGSFKTVINWAAPIRSEAGEITGAVALNEDVTALQQTQEQLRKAVRDREDILAIVAHDLRNPLAALAMTALTVEKKVSVLAEGGPIRTLAQSIGETARRMSGLVDDLLAVSLPSGERSMLNLAPITPADLLKKAAESARPLFDRRALALQVQMDSDLMALRVDTDRILRVFANLLDNALKFTSTGGRVLLTAQGTAAGVRFCVANTGEALPSAALQSMFQPFWQAGRGDRRGAGLGLAICRSIIEAHGGSIWAEPATGERVRICFVLPRSPVPAL